VAAAGEDADAPRLGLGVAGVAFTFAADAPSPVAFAGVSARRGELAPLEAFVRDGTMP
jgi:hypothetical protein